MYNVSAFEREIMYWFKMNNRKVGEVMTINQFNCLRCNTKSQKEYNSFTQALELLIKDGYLQVDIRNNYSLTQKGFDFINNR